MSTEQQTEMKPEIKTSVIVTYLDRSEEEFLDVTLVDFHNYVGCLAITFTKLVEGQQLTDCIYIPWHQIHKVERSELYGK